MRASKNVCVWERDRKGRTSTFSPSLKASWSPTIWILWRLLHRSWQSILNWIPNLGQHIVRQRDYAAQIPGCQSAKADNVLQTRKNPSSSLWSLGWRGRNKQTVCERGGSWVGHKPSQGSVPFFNCYDVLLCLGSSLTQSQSQNGRGCVSRVISLFEGEQSAVDQVLTCSVLTQSWISGVFYSFIYSSTVWTLYLNAKWFHLLGPPSTLTQDIWSSARVTTGIMLTSLINNLFSVCSVWLDDLRRGLFFS